MVLATGLEVVVATLEVARVEGEAAATANLLFATTAAAEDELTLDELELALALVLRVVGVAEELEAGGAALELAFSLELEATLGADLTGEDAALETELAFMLAMLEAEATLETALALEL